MEGDEGDSLFLVGVKCARGGEGRMAQASDKRGVYTEAPGLGGKCRRPNNGQATSTDLHVHLFYSFFFFALSLFLPLILYTFTPYRISFIFLLLFTSLSLSHIHAKRQLVFPCYSTNIEFNLPVTLQQLTSIVLGILFLHVCFYLLFELFFFHLIFLCYSSLIFFFFFSHSYVDIFTFFDSISSNALIIQIKEKFLLSFIIILIQY